MCLVKYICIWCIGGFYYFCIVCKCVHRTLLSFFLMMSIGIRSQHDHTDGLMQESCNSIANALELSLSWTHWYVTWYSIQLGKIKVKHKSYFELRKRDHISRLPWQIMGCLLWVIWKNSMSYIRTIFWCIFSSYRLLGHNGCSLRNPSYLWDTDYNCANWNQERLCCLASIKVSAS